jgi:hypothetical protein
VDHRSDGRGGGGPRRELGSRVHGGPGLINEGVCDPSRPRAIEQPWWPASGARQRARRRQSCRDGASPAQARDGVPGHHFKHGWLLCIAGEHAHMPKGSRERLGRPRRPAPEGGGSASPASS